MANISKSVHRFVEQDLALRKDLSRGIVNIRSAAAYIKSQARLSASIDAVISALRRIESGSKDAEPRFSKAITLIRNAKITTRNHIAIIALKKDSSVQEAIPRLFSLIDYSRGEALRIIQAEELLKVVVDQRNAAAVSELFTKNKIIHMEKNLAEVNVHLDPVSSKVPGILAIFNTELANRGINIVESMTCVPELLWFIDETDLLNAHQTFLELMSEE
ncbi:hypothetical protein HYY74_00815 [Candidatus Woesearchaeota archaeon]|nr:hypothetical protein [Candidatus Woesearchaeota archaeon]